MFAINMNLWNEAGLTEDDFPETWDDVLAICQVFKDQLGMTGLCLNTQEFHFTQYALSFGGGWGLGKTINTPENAAALQFLIDAYHQGYVVTPKELGVSYDGSVLMTEVFHHLETGEPVHYTMDLNNNLWSAAMLDAGIRSSRSLRMEEVKTACWTIG